jgi:regulator of ribosome biosynthesis
MRPLKLQKFISKTENDNFYIDHCTCQKQQQVLSMADPKERSKLPVAVTKPTPYTFDLGLLLANDPNPLLLQGNLEDDLSATARDGAQALLNQLLSTCPITSTPSGVLLSLPAISTPLPREKVPTPLKSTPCHSTSSLYNCSPR